MTFRQFAINNVLRNKRLYAAYFLSSLFTVMVFFTFAIFAFHPSFQSADFNKDALVGLGIAGGIIYVFSFFFVLYSMSAFLQSRKKEFGLLMMQGTSTGQIRLMIFMENMLIGLLATISGILLGLIFAKLILMIAENVLIIDATLNFYWPWMAAIVTFASFIVLFLFISFFVSFILRTRKLIDLIKSDRKSKGEPKASAFLAILAAILLIAGYGIALYVRGVQVVMALLPVVILVTLGTYLLFTQLSVFIIRRMKRKESIFWNKTNMILFSDLSFRMKDNARSFFMVAIISTVAFSAIGALFGTYSYLTKGVREANPFTYQFFNFDEKSDFEQDIRYASRVMQKDGIEADGTMLRDNTYPLKGDDEGVLVVKASDYNKAARLIGEKPLEIGKNEVIVGKQSAANMMKDTRTSELMEKGLKLQGGKVLKPTYSIRPEALQHFDSFFIAGNEVYSKLPKPVNESKFFIWQAKKGSDPEQVRKTGQKLSEHFQPGSFQSIDAIIYMIEVAYGPALFIGLFIGIVFFVSAGSFLYFRLFTDLSEDKAKFSAISKIGLTTSEMKRVANRQTALLFFAPMVVALIHGAVALTALSHMFDYNLVKESVAVLASFLVIQVVYYLFVRYFYVKQIREAIE
ncbi:ABC transporter permease [Aciduricibacillus chroicocephali]|uniref:ABC transporter permease n=1 Tax=Aciduricibacillus chroicocephali TaxID=3054939 RepID=A0ABY9KUL4_9BACI|nr:ABC transporter permease [Bacillaceae bacterium 44XB]